MATQKRPLPDVGVAKADTLRTIADIFDQNYQDHAFNPPVGGGGGGVFSYTANDSLYGENNTAQPTAQNAIQIGNGAVTSNSQGIAIGASANASGGGLAIGPLTTTTGVFNIAIGPGTSAIGSSALGVGYGVSAGSYSTAIGYNVSTAYYSVAVGAVASTSAYYGVAIGNQAVVQNSAGIAIGFQASVTHDSAVAIGPYVGSYVASSVTIGVSNTEKVTFDTWTPTADTPTATHVLPFFINGVRYYILMTNVAP